MTRCRSFPGFGLILALVLVLTSAFSAAQMGPDQMRHHQEALMGLAAFSPDDLCGTMQMPQDHDHPCPFCHKLPEPERLTVPDRVQRLSLPYRPDRSTRLIAGPQQVPPDLPLRAPPLSA